MRTRRRARAAPTRTLARPPGPAHPTPLQHFVANELEHWNGTDRYHIDVFVPQQDLVDSYLPSFQACVEEGKATGIMCR